MIFGIGIDQAEVERIKVQLDKESGLKERLFTSYEIEYCETKKNHAQNFAARFAAKEALLKAIGTGLRDGLAFRDIEVINDDLGKPQLVLHREAKAFLERHSIKATHVSLSHTKESAIAIVILEK